MDATTNPFGLPVTGPTDVPPPGATTGHVTAWLDECERRAIHPHRIEDALRRAGWAPATAAGAASEYRQRFDEHRLGYTALLVTTGIAALAAGSAGHLLAAGIYEPVNRDALGQWLTIMVCSLPFAVWAHVWAARVDREDPAAVWSAPRQSWSRALLWACGIIGVLRLLVYAGQLIGVIVGASWADGVSLTAGAVNVSITVGIALPLSLWAHWFLHRFDREDPSAPGEHSRSQGQRVPWPRSA
jgi:hypothetical protein